MKRAFFFIMIFFGLYPVLRDGELLFAGPETAACQNAGHILMRYLEKKDGSRYYYLPVPHNCGCAVAQYSSSGEFVQYHYATKEFYKSTPEFQAFIDSAGMDHPFFPADKQKVAATARKKQPEKKEGGLEWMALLLLPGFLCSLRLRFSSIALYFP